MLAKVRHYLEICKYCNPVPINLNVCVTYYNAGVFMD